MTMQGMQEWGQSTGRNLGDQIIYYRRPKLNKLGEPAENAGWITWGDSISGTKLRDFVARGFEPLMKYGSLNNKERRLRAEAEGWPPGRILWDAILTHPDGPAEFTLEQIMAFRWYRPEQAPVLNVRFPQLAGQTVREYRCPECSRPPFIDIEGVGGITGLGNHLRIMHGWDRVSLNAYGDRVGINFNQTDVVTLAMEEMDIPAVKCDCGWEPSADSKDVDSSLRAHQNLHCPLRKPVEVETVA